MRSRALLWLGILVIVLGACSSAKDTTPTSGRTLSNENAYGAGSTPPSQRGRQSQAQVPAEPDTSSKQPSPPPVSKAPRNRHHESSPSSIVNGGPDTPEQSDQREARITPLDQSESPDDLETTRKIRQAVVQDAALSFRAKNVTIVTNGDRVVLTGQVNSRAEADRIKDIARSVTPHRIEDQLEIRR